MSLLCPCHHNAPTLAEIKWRVEEISERIEQARAANQRRLIFSAFEPLIEDLSNVLKRLHVATQ